MRTGRMKGLLVAFVSAAIPFVTIATCNPNTGAFDFFRDDGSDHWEDDELFFQEDVFFYDDPYFDDGFYLDDCAFCF